MSLLAYSARIADASFFEGAPPVQERRAVSGRKGIVGERDKKEIALLSVRAGDIVGEHTVIFGGIGERLEFIHRAHSRDTSPAARSIAFK